MDSSMELSRIAGNKLLLVGVGGGGCNAVSRMREGWAEGPPCLVIDTDAHALEEATMEHRLALGESLTQGKGAGGHSDVGKLAAEDDRERLRDIVSGYEVVVINAALGRGTGSGAAPVLGQVAQEAGVLVISFVTLPFSFEGEEVQRRALVGLRDIRMYSDVVIVQSNDLLVQTSGDQPLPEAFLVADTMIGVGVRALWRLLTRPGLIHLSFADIRQVVVNSGKTCAYGFGMGQGENRAADSVADLLESPLLDHGLQLAKSASLLIQIVAGPDVTLVEIQEAMDAVRDHARDGAHLAFGVAIEPEWETRMAITLLCSEEWPVELDTTTIETAPESATPDEVVEKDGAKEATSGRAKSKANKSGKAARRKELQEKLASGKGRFQGIEPTFHDGQDLDIPTFQRKGVRLSGDV